MIFMLKYTENRWKQFYISGVCSGMIEKMYENSGWLVPDQDMNNILAEYKLAVLVLSESAQNNGNVSFVFREHTWFEYWLDITMLRYGMKPDNSVHGLPRRCRQQVPLKC